MNAFFENINFKNPSIPLKEIQNLNININNNNSNNFLKTDLKKCNFNTKNCIYYSINTNKNENNNYILSNEINFNNKICINIKDIMIQFQNTNNIVKNEKNKKNKKASFDSSKENKNFKNIKMNNEIPIKKNQKNSLNENKNTNIVDPLSEVIKFKTELCHSWELSGNCKYGENVIKYIYFNIIYFFIILQCVFAHGVFDLRNPIIEEKNQSYNKVM